MLDQNNDQRFRFRDVLKLGWNPKSLQQPQVDPEIRKLDAITRSAESIRYSILSFEFWISPDGQIREWIRNNSKVAAVLSIPAFLVLPIVTFAFWQLASWAAAITSIG